MKMLILPMIMGVAIGSAHASDLHSAVTASAVRHGVPPALAHGVVRVESGYRCGVSGGGAHGIMQVKPRTAAGVGVHGNLHNCATGLEAGMRYLRQAYAIAGGNWCVAASLYNRGTGAGRACTGYGRKVIGQGRRGYAMVEG